MTSGATFGDCADAASMHLEHDVPSTKPAGRRRGAAARSRQIEEFAGCLRGVLEVMARYLAEITAPLAGASARDRGLVSSWARAGIEARDALGCAMESLAPGGQGTAGRGQAGVAGWSSGGLDAAAAAMRTGRDLLQTHSGTGPDGGRRDHSEWAPVVTSAPVTRALLLEVGSWARRAASQGARLTLPGGPVQRSAGETRRRLSVACQWLFVLDSAVQAAHRREPVTAADARLLYAIPVNAVPARSVPDGTETVAGLCEGTVRTAGRVRHVTWLLVSQASWSRGLTVDSLRQSAGCATVISHNCEILLRGLATRAAAHGDGPMRAGLLESADAAGLARDAWLHAARAWNLITTDVRGTISPTAAETADLALWTGRLAYADPGWTLERGPSQAIRPPEALVPGPGDLPGVVAAVHHACETLTQLAAADEEQIRTAADASRLLVPTRSLPEKSDVPHPFALAPRGRVDQVLLGYRDARTASACATATVAEIAVTVGAPSEILASARAAVHSGGGLPASRRPYAAEPAAGRWPSWDVPGHVERALHDLGISSPARLRRAAAIDHAGEQLILDSRQAAHARRRQVAPAEPSRPADPGRSADAEQAARRLIPSGNARAAAIRRPAAFTAAADAEAEP